MAFVQAQADAAETEMPERAIEALGDKLDGALPAGELGAHIASLVGSSAPAAVKGLEQRSQMLKGLARAEGIRGRELGARNFEEEAQLLREHAHTLRTVLLASLPAPNSGS